MCLSHMIKTYHLSMCYEDINIKKMLSKRELKTRQKSISHSPNSNREHKVKFFPRMHLKNQTFKAEFEILRKITIRSRFEFVLCNFSQNFNILSMIII